MIAKSGHALLSPDAVTALRDELLPLADLLTPNLPEAAALLDMPLADDEAGMLRQGEALRALGARAVLMKGGHLGGTQSPGLAGGPGRWLATPERGSRASGEYAWHRLYLVGRDRCIGAATQPAGAGGERREDLSDGRPG